MRSRFAEPEASGTAGPETRRARPLLGTFVEIVVPDYGADPMAAMNRAFAAVEEVQRQMSFHDPASTLSRLNREAAHRPVAVEPWTREVLLAAGELHRLSRGVFDVTIGSRLQRLGFLPGEAGAESGGSFAEVEISDSGEVRFLRADLRIDLGGIAKGFAVDCAVEALRDAGVPAGLANAGGDLRTFGERSFPVAIRHPEAPGCSLAVVQLREAGLATSAHYFAGRLLEGAEQAPIVHPRRDTTPVLPPSVTVRASGAMIADGLTKVVMLDAEHALSVLAHYGAEAFFISPEGEVVCTENWNASLDLSS